MSKKHVFLKFFSKIALFACVFCALFISPVFATLPAGYTELEYIESTGTQYIDTGYAKPSVNIDLKVRVSFADNTGRYLIGVSSASPNYIGRHSPSASFEMNNVRTNMRTVINEPYDMHYYKNNNSLYLVVTDKNGNSETLTAGAGVTSANNWSVFANNGDSGVGSILKGRIYSFVLSSDGVSVRNLIPAKRNSDGEIGMYDTVSGTFFENAGTGDFIAGPIAHCETFGANNVTCTACKSGYKLDSNGGCVGVIEVATTKMVDDEFAPLDTALANAISVVDNVVTQTIAQAAAIGELQNTKQTRPDDDDECPAGKKCLLVTDESGTPHWYEIIEP